MACHQFQFLERMDVLDCAEPGATFLLNAPFGADEVWGHLPQSVQEVIIQKRLKFYLIDAYQVARETGMGNRINTIMQTCFFAISGVLPREQAIEAIKNAIVRPTANAVRPSSPRTLSPWTTPSVISSRSRFPRVATAG